MIQDENTLNLTADAETAIDPREALYNDYCDGVRTAHETLKMFHRLREEGFIKFGDKSPWWRDFLARLTVEVESDPDHNS